MMYLTFIQFVIHLKFIIMLKSFFKIAIRYLWRKRTYSLLNFLCLTFGITCAIITSLYIRNVFSYDKFHKNYNRLYSVNAYVTYFNGDRFPKEYLSASLSDVLKVQAPEIENITRIAERDYSFTNDDKTFTEKGLYADDNFFEVFTFPFERSGKKKSLSDPNSIAISAHMAIKLFETTDCLGKTLILKDGDKKEVFEVSDVFYDVPKQSKIQFDFVIPFSKFLADNSWAIETGATANETWILLRNESESAMVSSRIKNLIKDQESTLNQELFIFPLREQILYSYAGGKRVWKEMQNVVIIGSIGFAILLIACFNYINLSVALNIRRYKEAGIKKATGSSRSSIIIHFVGETFILTILSLLCAVILVRLLLTGFNTMFNNDIRLGLMNVAMIAWLIAIALFTGMVSGLLPAFYLASSSPVDALKGKIITSHSYSTFRQSLIIFQFSIPIVLIICMIIIKTQDNYLRKYDAGVDRDRTIVLDNSVNIQSHAESVRTELLAIPGIDAVSFTNCIPTRGAQVSSEVTWEGKDASQKLHFWCVNSDFDYDKTVKINLINGRFFNPSYSTDSAAYLINDIAAGIIKNEKVLGSLINVEGRKGTIIGVFKDFHSIDLAGPIVPTIMRIKSDGRPIILVRFSSGSFQVISDQIRTVFKQYESETPFRATLFRDLRPFSDLSLPSNLVGLAFIIAILLGCMGLFGLASFTSENRTKEIGIRKANGATTISVMRLLLTSYAKWLTIAFIMALPIAYLLGMNFMGRFYFHAPMPFWAFLAGPLIAFVVALLTVSTQTWSVCSRNPVKSLRYE
jgi:putative ABC transport system permease protein